MTHAEHTRLDLPALEASDCTVRDGRRLIWLGVDGTEGQWLTLAQFREHAAALAKFSESLPAERAEVGA